MTRLAPSPTGALHLGNARTFLINWVLARKHNWRIILRIEDLDTPRVKAGAIEQAVETLAWLGLDWDEGPLIQSCEPAPHRAAMRRLAAMAAAYPCELTRAQIDEAASAPHPPIPVGDSPARGGGEHDPASVGPGQENVFPSSLRPELVPLEFVDEATNWRFAVQPGRIGFVDGFRGAVELDPSRSIGDFVIWTKRGQPSYQLAVVVDDHRQGVSRVVRGDDLVDSTGRQLLLYRALGYGPEPFHIHLPLVVGPDGRRLAKRHGDTRLDHYREAGVGPEVIIGLIAHWACPDVTDREPMSVEAFSAVFGLDRMPREATVFDSEDDAWLMSMASR